MRFRIAIVILFAAVFLVQVGTDFGYFTQPHYKTAFIYASFVVPMVGYFLLAFWLPSFRNLHIALRILVSLSLSIFTWYTAGLVITALLLMTRVVPPR